MVAKLETTSHNTTQHTTTNMSRYHPNLQWLCPISPWIRQRHPQIIAPSLPMSLLQAPSTGFALATAGFLVWGNDTKHIKKQTDRGGIGLRWLLFGNKNNNQHIVGGNDRRDDGEGARLGCSIWGGCCLFMWGSELSNAKNTKIKYVVALDGCVIIFHTQQPTNNMRAQ